MRDVRRVLTFALFGACGAFFAAILGEAWLRITYQKPAIVEADRRIALVLDCSGSMAGGPMAEMRSAAKEFVRGRDLAREKIGVIGFGTNAFVAVPLTSQTNSLLSAIDEVNDGGGTDMGGGLAAGKSLLQSELNTSIVLFTDGLPSNSLQALWQAQSCRAANIEIIAVSTGDSDDDFLARLTGDRSLVFRANAGDFSQAFRAASQSIGKAHLLESGRSGGGWLAQIIRLGGWTSLIGGGIASLLVIGQNYYLSRYLGNSRQLIRSASGGFMAGIVAGCMVQAAFNVTAGLPLLLVEVCRIGGWFLMGALVGLMIAFFIPNLKPLHGTIGGAIGGVLGGVIFTILSLATGDLLGRLLGAAILGFMIGAMIAIAEIASRKFWLDVVYGTNEVRRVTLGMQPVCIGSNRERCQVIVPNQEAIVYRYTMRNSTVFLEECATGREQAVKANDTRQLGTLQLIVRDAPNSSASVMKNIAPTFVGGSSNDGNKTTQNNAGVDTRSTPVKPETVTATPVAMGKEPSGCFLNVSGRLFPLVDGVGFTGEQLRLREAPLGKARCAEVIRNPVDPTVFGLKNLMAISWKATLASGESRSVEPGKSLRIARGSRINIDGIILLIE